MKTLKSTGVFLILVVAFLGAKAATITGNYFLNKEEVINIYLNAVVHGKLGELDDAIDEYASFNMIRGGQNVNTLNKNQLLRSLKSSENIEQDCKCTSSVVREDSDATVWKVEMKYNDFTRTDMVTAERAGSGWKITKVDTSSK